jgi:spermidine/putrescine transport system permease protein
MSSQSIPGVEDLVGSPPSAGQPPKRKANKRKKAVPYLLASPSVFWLLAFFLLPTIYMFQVSLNDGLLGTMSMTWKWANYSFVFKTYGHLITRSVGYALAATIITLVIGYPVAYRISFFGGKRKNVYLLLLLVPFFVSFVLRTYQWTFILADQGMVLGPLKRAHILSPGFHILSTPYAVIFGIAYNFLPFTVLPLYVALERVEPRLIEAGRDLYANRWTTFWKVVWPLSIPGVFAAFLLTFVPAVGDFINAAYLGGTKTTMIGTIIQNLYLNDLDYAHGAALSFILMAFLVVGASLYARALGTDAVMEAAGR